MEATIRRSCLFSVMMTRNLMTASPSTCLEALTKEAESQLNQHLSETARENLQRELLKFIKNTQRRWRTVDRTKPRFMFT